MMDATKDVKENDEATSASSETTDDVTANEQETDKSKSTSTEEDGADGGDEDSGIDYKAELKRLTESRDRAIDIAHFERKKRQDGEKKDETKTDDKAEDAESRLMKRLEEQRLQDAEDAVDEELESISDPDERTLTRWYYENRVNRQGYSRRKIREDLEDARAMANKQLISKIKAAARAEGRAEAKREQSASGSSGGSSTRRSPKTEGPKLSSEEEKLLAMAKKAAAQIR